MEVTGLEGLESRRLLAVVAPDVAFAKDGILLPDAAIASADPAIHLVHADSGGLLVTTYTGDIHAPHLRLERLSFTGQPDPSFTPVDLPHDDVSLQYPFGDRQGRLLVLDYDYRVEALRVTRYNTDGTLDTSFGKNGIATAATLRQLGSDSFHTFWQFHLTESPDGSIYLAGLDEGAGVTGDYFNRSLFKLTANGRIDSTFGDGGQLNVGNKNIQLDFVSSQRPDDGFTFHVDAAGRLLVGQTPAGGQFRFTRYLPNGQVDTTYGRRGTFTYTSSTDPDFSVFDRFYAAYDDQGRALLLTNGSPSRLVRLTVNGHLDPGFGTDGTATVAGRGEALIVQADGNIVVQAAGDEGDTFIRIRPDGTPDPTFDTDGAADLVQFGSYAPRLITQLADGSYLAETSTDVGTTLEKIELAAPARRGNSGRLYLLGGSGSDRVGVSQTASGITHVIMNGQGYDFARHITGIQAILFAGNNRYAAPLDLPQEVYTGRGHDTITTGDRGDRIVAGRGNDTIRTAGGYDVISFSGGDKQIDAGSGSGYITGGSRGGTDLDGELHLRGTTTDDAREGGWRVDVRGTRVHVTLGGGSATVQVEASLTASVDATGVRSHVAANIQARTARFTGGPANTTAAIFGRTASYVVTGPGDDSLHLAGGNADVSSGPGDDKLFGTTANDTLDGGGGNDRISGFAGNDSLLGGEGNDTLVGGTGIDTVQGGGGRGNDRLYGGDVGAALVPMAFNILDGGAGRDIGFPESDGDILAGIESVH